MLNKSLPHHRGFSRFRLISLVVKILINEGELRGSEFVPSVSTRGSKSGGPRDERRGKAARTRRWIAALSRREDGGTKERGRMLTNRVIFPASVGEYQRRH